LATDSPHNGLEPSNILVMLGAQRLKTSAFLGRGFL